MSGRLIEPGAEAIARGRRFMARRDAWRSGTSRFYAPHEAFAPYAPAILAACFDRALRDLHAPPSYVLVAGDIQATVSLNAETWRWLVRDGTAAGEGLIELWAWRWELAVHIAAAQCMAVVQDSAHAEVAA